MGQEEEQALYKIWRQVVNTYELPVEKARDTYNQLLDRYRGGEAQGNRAYHNVRHLRQVVTTVTRLGAYAAELPAVQLAAFFHDVVYEPGAADNEARSAAYAHRELAALGTPLETIGEVARLILLTQTHEVAPDDGNGAVLLDADLAILGAPAPAYRRYARAIRREYVEIPDAVYRPGRAAVLRRFLEREQIYRTPPLRAELEEKARRNLRRELTTLAAAD